MELHQLRYLSAVAHCGSAAKAAEELYVSKQAVSKAIRSFEHEMGFELFDRDDGMRLTENGREILVHAEAVLRELDEIDLYVQAQGAGARQTESLAIAFKSFPLDYLFFNKGHEAVETRVITLRSNPFGRRASVRIADLEGVPIRSPFDFDLFTNAFITACHEHGFDPSFREVPLNDEAIDAFCSGGGVHLQPFDPRMEKAYPQSVFLPFHPSDRIELPLCLAYRETLAKPLALKLVGFIRNGMRR